MRLGTAREFGELAWALAKVGLGIASGIAIVVVGLFVYEYLTH